MTKAQYNELGFEGWDADKAHDIINSNINYYDNYLQGNVYGYSFFENTDEDADAIDACGGFVGDHDDSGLFEQIDLDFQYLMLQQDAKEKRARKERCAQLKHLIQNRVHLDKRAKVLCQQ